MNLLTLLAPGLLMGGSPASAPTLVYDLVADDLMWQDLSATVPAVNNTLVAAAGNFANNVAGQLVTQLTSGLRPTLLTNQINGHAALSFSGGQVLDTWSQMLAPILALSGDASLTMMVVCKPANITQPLTPASLGNFNLPAGNSMSLILADSGALPAINYGGDAYVVFQSYDTSWQLFTASKTSGLADETTTFYRNGVAQSITETIHDLTPDLSGFLSIGAVSNGAAAGFPYYFDGLLAEVQVWIPALSGSALVAAQQALIAKYKIGLAYPQTIFVGLNYAYTQATTLDYGYRQSMTGNTGDGS